MRCVDRTYTVSTTGVMTLDGPTQGQGPSYVMGPNGGAANALGPEFSGNLLRHWSLVVEQVGAGAFNGIIQLRYKQTPQDVYTAAETLYRSVPSDDAVGVRMHHVSAAGTFFETTGQTWIPVGAIAVIPANMGTVAANTTCRVYFHAEYEV